jgi:hypothetical protein
MSQSPSTPSTPPPEVATPPGEPAAPHMSPDADPVAEEAALVSAEEPAPAAPAAEPSCDDEPVSVDELAASDDGEPLAATAPPPPVAPAPTAPLDAVSFVSHPDHDEVDYEAGRIASVRMDAVAIGDLADLQFLGTVPPVTDDTAVVAVIIERTTRGSAALLTHTYGTTAAVVNYLQDAAEPMLAEDARLVEFALSMTRPGGLAQRALLHRRVKPLEDENRLLREALGVGRKTRVTASVVAGIAAARRAATNPAPRKTADRPATVPEKRHGSPPRAASPAATDAGLHSPLNWDMETEAAINARTPYDSRTRRHKSPNRLDRVTQSQLVTRLHDKSVDSRKLRLAELASAVGNEGGKLERRVLSGDEEHELGVRLHDRQRVHTREVLDTLKGKYLAVREEHKLSMDVQKASAVRMHDATMAKAQENLTKLFDQYVEDLDHRKLSREQQELMADRLCQPIPRR